MEGSYVEKTWSVFESHSRNTLCEWNVFEEGGISISKTRAVSISKLEPLAIHQRECQRNKRYQVAENVCLWNKSLYLEIDFLSACYGCRLFSPQKFLSFALLKQSRDLSWRVSAWLEYQTCKLYAKQTIGRTIRQARFNKKVMKAARD